MGHPEREVNAIRVHDHVMSENPFDLSGHVAVAAVLLLDGGYGKF